MTVNISTRQIAGVTILDINGRLVWGEETDLLHNTICDMLARGNKNLLVNMGQMSYFDNSGIGELVRAWADARRQGGDLKLLNPTRKVGAVLQITKLVIIFEIFDTEVAALQAFAKREQQELNVGVG